MRIAFITRSTLNKVPGGDTVQIEQTAKCLRQLGAEVDVILTNKKIAYSNYDLFHFFNINRPADILFHMKRIKAPFVLSPILVDYSEYDKYQRRGLAGAILKGFSADRIEYIKTIARWITGKDSLKSRSYIWSGHRNAILSILEKAAALLPNTEAEYRELKKRFNIEKPFTIVPNGIDEALFIPAENNPRNDKLVISAARIEGIKNQLNLIKALNNTDYTLLLIGSPAPNQKSYYRLCRRIASSNIIFKDHIPQEELVAYYKEAKVHVLPSWFETCGLSSLEAAAMGCNIVITDKGYAREYFGDHAFYCDPSSPASIREAVERASENRPDITLQERIYRQYTWQQAAGLTLEAYKNIVEK